MMTPNSVAMRGERGQVRTQCEAVGRWSLVVGMAVLLGMVVGASAQTVHFRTAQLRQTVPVASSGSVVWSNYAVLTGVSESVTVSVEGLPPGATATVNPTSLTASGPVLVTLQWDNVAEGEYPFRLQGAGGATNHLILTLQVAHIWNGQDQVQGQWSSPANWVGGQVPPEGADIVFSDLGGQTALFTNIVVDQDVTVGSLRFATTNTTRFHTLSIASGRTLRVVGPLGLRLLRDYVSEWAGLGNGPTVTFVGPQAALVVSNEQAEIAITLDNQITHTVDLSALGVLVADVHRVGLADYASFPNFGICCKTVTAGSRAGLCPMCIWRARTSSAPVTPTRRTTKTPSAGSFPWPICGAGFRARRRSGTCIWALTMSFTWRAFASLGPISRAGSVSIPPLPATIRWPFSGTWTAGG